MRNRIKLIILLVTIIILTYAMINGINIGKIKILSISEINSKNNLLNKRIEEASRIVAIDYPNSTEELEGMFEKYSAAKRRYADLVGSKNGKKNNTYETKKYDITYLWRLLGKYATTNNLTLTINVETVNYQEGIFNLNFTVLGQYTNIIEFIEYVERNSDLHFRIYDLNMNGGGEIIRTSFKVKNIYIDSTTITSST